jgi:tetratricopeptide (TPR) repeat protein
VEGDGEKIAPARLNDERFARISHLVESDRAAAANLLRQVLFDLRRGACAATGEQAMSLADTAAELGLSSECIDLARLALELGIDDAHRLGVIAQLVGALLMNGEPGAALAAATSIEVPAAATPNQHLALAVNAGEAERRLGLSDEALRRYRAVAPFVADADVDLQVTLEGVRATALSELGRKEEAISAFEHAIELDEEPNISLLSNLANALRDLGRYDEADTRYEEALAVATEPSDRGQLLSNRARMLKARGNRADAKTMLRDALELREPVDPAGAAITAEELAKVYADEYDFERAGDWAEVACSLRRSAGQDDDESLLDFLGMVRGVTEAFATRPDLGGELLLQRLRAAHPGEWPLVLHDPPRDVIDAAVTRLTAEGAGNTELGGTVEDRWLMALLERILTHGTQIALAEHSERLARVQEIAHSVIQVTSEEDWVARKRRYEAHRQVLERASSRDALDFVERRAEAFGLDREQVADLRALVRHSTVVGVDMAFAALPVEHPNQLVARLVNVGTWRESLRLVEAHPFLLTDDALNLLLETYEAMPSQHDLIGQHVEVLRRARHVGAAVAFAEARSSEPLGPKYWVGTLDAGGLDFLRDDVPPPPTARLLGIIEDAGDPELTRLAELAHATAQARSDRQVVRWEGLRDPAQLQRAAQALAAANQRQQAQMVLRRLGETWLERSGEDRVDALRAAASAFQNAIDVDSAAGQSQQAELRLLLGSTLWELWSLDRAQTGVLFTARDVFRDALRQSPPNRAPELAFEAARGLSETLGASLELAPHRSNRYQTRYLRVHTCRSAISASAYLLAAETETSRSARLSQALWAYQSAVDDLCELGFPGAALATAEHGRGLGFGLETEQNQHGAVADATVPTTADELTAFVEQERRNVVVLAWYTTATTCHVFSLHSGSGEVSSLSLETTPQRLEVLARVTRDAIGHRPSSPEEPLSPAALSVMGGLIPSRWRELLEDAEEIVLVPHGAVADLPLHALPVSWLGGRSLIELARVRYLPGVAVGNRLRGRSRHGDIALVMAHAGSDAVSDTDFAHEARVVATTVNTDHVYLGPEAHAGQIVTYAPRAGLMHVAAHGTFDDLDPQASGVLLSDGNGVGSKRFVARDVSRLPELPGTVIVLSGCETGRHSNDLTGEAFGLVRAFLLAGASAVVASQWRVDSPTTRTLMERFHSLLRDSDDVAGSLRTVSLAMKQEAETRHPYYWAPFVSIGARSDARG